MVDPFDVTHYSLDDHRLEEFFMFCVAVAGKKATMVAGKLDLFLDHAKDGETPFALVRRLNAAGELEDTLRSVKMGQYAKLTEAWAFCADGGIDVRTSGADDLQKVRGIGYKTARYFILHTRRAARVGVIDTHILKFLASRGHEVPSKIPNDKRYLKLEALILAEADTAGMTPADFDLAVWRHYASGGIHPLPTSPEFRAAA